MKTREKIIIVIIIVLMVFVTLMLPLLSDIHFLAVNYSKFYKPFPLEQILEIDYELKPHHISHSMLAITGLPLISSIPSIGFYDDVFLGPRAEYSYAIIPFLFLQWIPWISIPISYLSTTGVNKWRRILYVYLIAVYLGVLNMSGTFGVSSFDVFNQIL